MAFTRQVDFLEPVNLSEHLDKLELYLGQVCQIAGATVEVGRRVLKRRCLECQEHGKRHRPDGCS